jgi:hypothetical protein
VVGGEGGEGGDRDDLAEDADGGEAREPGEVHGRLRVAVAAQHAARHGAEREDVPRPREVARGAARVRQRCAAARASAGGRGCGSGGWQGVASRAGEWVRTGWGARGWGDLESLPRDRMRRCRWMFRVGSRWRR